MIIVSACLAGVNCKYNGRNSFNETVVRLVAEGKAIPVCPEQLGGCTTPRPAVEIAGGTGADVLAGQRKVVSENEEDATAQFIKGAREVLALAQMAGCKKAILKARSPSCGCGKIYDGTFSGKLIQGNGVTAELLLQHGITVRTEEEIEFQIEQIEKTL